MDGVTIVETINEVVEAPPESPWIIIFALIAISIAAAVEMIGFFKSKRILEGVATSLVIVVSIFLGFSSFGVLTTNKTTETLYVVTIDDNVSAKDFYENYEIISINDDKYTVRYIGK